MLYAVLLRVKPLNYACNDIDLNEYYAYLLIGMLHPWPAYFAIYNTDLRLVQILPPGKALNRLVGKILD